jgi:hypothetical protein
MKDEGTSPDHEFIVQFQVAIERYLCAVDQWESGTRKCYRFPGYPAADITSIESQRLEYQKCRRDLEPMLPRARQLCAIHHMDAPFDRLLQVQIGQREAGIGRRVRGAVSKCLMELHAACSRRYWGLLPDLFHGSFVQRVVSRFS